jgi:hypothetical protein
LVDQRSALINQLFANIMNQLKILLRNGFYRHHPFIRASGRFTDRFRIIKISFVANHIVFDKARIQQDDFMTELGQFSGPVMGTSARFYTNDTGWIVGKIRQLCILINLNTDSGRT